MLRALSLRCCRDPDVGNAGWQRLAPPKRCVHHTPENGQNMTRDVKTQYRCPTPITKHLCMYIYIYIYTHIHIHTHTTYIYIYNICLSVYLYIYLSIYLSICLSIYLSIYPASACRWWTSRSSPTGRAPWRRACRHRAYLSYFQHN